MNTSGPSTFPADELRIRAYLLGELEAAESERFEEDHFHDEELAKWSAVVEDELIDDYMHKRLVPAQRARFEQFYLVTDERVRRVEFAIAYHQQVMTPALPETVGTPGWRGLFTLPRLAWAALLILAALAGGRLFMQRPTSKELIASASPTPTLAPTIAPSPSLTPQSTATPVASPVVVPPRAVVASITLLPGGVRGGQTLPVLHLTPATTVAELKLLFRNAGFASYRAVLQRDGATVWTSPKHAAQIGANEQAEFIARVPSQHLRPGDYALLLFGGDKGQTEAADYLFRVTID